MDGTSFIIALLLAFIGLPVGVGLLLYFVPKKFGYPKIGKFLTVIYGLALLYIAFLFIFEDRLFTNNDAKELIEEQNIQLRDKFVLLDNSSSSGIGKYYHTFTLEISKSDKEQAIKEIRNAKDFQANGNMVDIHIPLYLRLTQGGKYFGPKVIQNYETAYSYVREYFQPYEKPNYAPTFRRISISKTENKLTFEDIDN